MAAMGRVSTVMDEGNAHTGSRGPMGSGQDDGEPNDGVRDMASDTVPARDASLGSGTAASDAAPEERVTEAVHVDLDLARSRGIDVDDPFIGLKIAAERLSIVRYVFLVQVEDGIAVAGHRAALEYADAVLIGWPEVGDKEIVTLSEPNYRMMLDLLEGMEQCITDFREQEADGEVDAMSDSLIRATGRVSQIRHMYQPDFPLPTFAEIRRVVQDEWEEDVGNIDPEESGGTVEAIEQQTEQADEQRQENPEAGHSGNQA